MDLLQGVKDAENEAAGIKENTVPEDGKDFKMPSIEDLLKALNKMDLSEDEREKFRQSLTGQSGFTEDKIDMLLNSIGKGRRPENEDSYQFLILFVLIGLVLLVLVLFGYKLYKSLAERERRKEEKRRQKQFRKKK